jgi:hypothetical protein
VQIHIHIHAFPYRHTQWPDISFSAVCLLFDHLFMFVSMLHVWIMHAFSNVAIFLSALQLYVYSRTLRPHRLQVYVYFRTYTTSQSVSIRLFPHIYNPTGWKYTCICKDIRPYRLRVNVYMCTYTASQVHPHLTHYAIRRKRLMRTHTYICKDTNTRMWRTVSTTPITYACVCPHTCKITRARTSSQGIKALHKLVQAYIHVKTHTHAYAPPAPSSKAFPAKYEKKPSACMNAYVLIAEKMQQQTCMYVCMHACVCMHSICTATCKIYGNVSTVFNGSFYQTTTGVRLS